MCAHIISQKKKNVEWNCGNDITEIGGKKNCPNWFVAMSLPKLRGGKCGNGIAEIEERYKKKYAYSYSFSIFFNQNSLVCHVLLWQKKVEWNCGNGIAELAGKKIYSSWFVAMPLPKLREKKCGNEFE